MTRSNFLKSRKGLFLIAVVIGSGLAIVFGSVYANNLQLSTVQIDLTPTKFRPTQVNSRLFDVSSTASRGNLLRTNVNYSYLDPNGQYPGVTVFQSNPYFSDADGNPSTNLSILNFLQTKEKIVIGDTVYYVHEYTQTIQIGARTNWNTHPIGDTTTKVSPFYGLAHGDRKYGLSRYDPEYRVSIEGDLVMWDQFQFHKGRLDGWWNKYAPYAVSQTKATVSSSIVKMYWPNIMAGSAGTETVVGYAAERGWYTPSGAGDYIFNNFGNKDIFVYPRINVHGLSNYIQYKGFDYDLKLSNGTTIKVSIDTNGAYVGFVDVRQTGEDINGLVPQRNPAGVNAQTYFKAGDVTTTTSKGPVEGSVDPTESGAGIALTGYLRPQPTLGYPDPSSYWSAMTGYTTSLDGTNPQIVVDDEENNCGMPQDLLITPEFRLKPLSTIYWTRAEVKWDSLRRNWDGALINYDDRTGSGTGVIYWPYALDLTNVYTIGQFTYTTAVVTKNDITMVTDTGAPIDVEKLISDFGSAAIIKNPNTDLAEVRLDVPPPFNPFGDWWNNLFGGLFGNIGTIFTWVMVIAGIFIALIVMNKVGVFKRRPSTATATTPMRSGL